MNRTTTRQLVLAAMFTALGVLLPVVLHPFGIAGQVFLPMHIPVLLCGFIVGWRFGALVGLIVPLISAALTGMPPVWPIGVSMALELAAYGFFAGFLYEKLSVIFAKIGAVLAASIVVMNSTYRLSIDFVSNKLPVIVSLIGAMLAGRIVMGAANVILFGFTGDSYTFSAFIAGAFITAWPGIVIQLILIPAVLYGLKASKLVKRMPVDV
jgi:thiamine transporter ThiT